MCFVKRKMNPLQRLLRQCYGYSSLFQDNKKDDDFNRRNKLFHQEFRQSYSKNWIKEIEEYQP